MLTRRAGRLARPPATCAGADRWRRTLEHALAAAREALAAHPEQLEALARAGVVDAGGQGVVVLLEALADTVSGRRDGPRSAPRPAGRSAARPRAAATSRRAVPAYEVMYLLDAADDAVAALRTTLDGARRLARRGRRRRAVERARAHRRRRARRSRPGIAAGRPHRIRVTHFAEQRGARVPPAQPVPRATGVAVVAAAAGPGLARLFAECGASVVRSAPGRRASTGRAARRGARPPGRSPSSCCPTTPTPWPRPGPRPRRPATRGCRWPCCRPGPRCRGWPRSPCTTRAARPSEDLVRMAAAAAATRHGAVTRGGPRGADVGRLVPGRRRAGRRRRRRRRGRRRPAPGRPHGRCPGCWPPAASCSPW